MICRRLVISLRFGLLCHLLVHSPAFRPLLTPVIPPLDAVRDALKVIGVHAIGNEPGSPVVDCALYTFISRHVVILSIVQFFAHPVCLLRPVFIRNVVTDMVAILKHPQLCPAACFLCYAPSLRGWYKPIQCALDDQQRTLNLLRHTSQVELPQFVERILLVSGFETVNQRFAAYLRAPFEVLGLVIRSAVFNRAFYAVFKGRATYRELTAKPYAHPPHPPTIDIFPALKILNSA